MIDLTRTVRFTTPSAHEWHGLPRYGELDVTCRGPVDSITGFFLNIQAIDAAVRGSAGPILDRAAQSDPPAISVVIVDLFRAVNTDVDGALRRLCWRLTPAFALTMEAENMQECLVHQRYEFAASHRLHAPSLSEEENRTIFGKCNNENGHGHNYHIEVVIRSPAGADTIPVGLDVVDRLVRETVLDRFDHKHLNLDCDEFAELNPTVENIVMVCHDLLQTAFGQENIMLHHVTIWETEKTSCTFPVEGSTNSG